MADDTNKLRLNKHVLNQLHLFLSGYYSDDSIADYIFNIFSIHRSLIENDELAFEKFSKMLNYIQLMSGDHAICFNAGRHFGQRRLLNGSTLRGVRFSAKKAFHNAHGLLDEAFPGIKAGILSKSKSGIRLLISESGIDYFVAEYIRGILSYIPNYWGLPSAAVRIRSYPFDLESLLSSVDVNFQKKEGAVFAYEKIIAGETNDYDDPGDRKDGKPVQVVSENQYIKHIFLPKETLYNTGCLKMEISWVNKKKAPFLSLWFFLLAGTAALIISSTQRIFGHEVVIPGFILFVLSAILIYNIYLRKLQHRLMLKIEADLTDELSSQKGIISGALGDSATRIRSIENLMMISKRLVQEENIATLFDNIRKLTAMALNADRATVFIHDKENRELRSGPELSEEKQEFRMPESKGIAGEIFKLRKIVNIKDAYNNPNFNKNIDRQTGYRTKTILGAPLIDLNDNLVGIIQVLNKKDGEFQKIDEQILESLSNYIAIALKNTLTLHKLQLQGIDPEIAKGLSAIIMSIYYSYQTIENELNLLDTPSINSLKPMIKELTELLEKMIFLFDDAYSVQNDFITTDFFEKSAREFTEHQKKEKIVKFSCFSSVNEQGMFLDKSIISKVISAIITNSIEAIPGEGEIVIHIFYYSEIPNILIHEYALQKIMEGYNRYSDENSIGLINYIKNRKPFLEKDLQIINNSIKEFVAVDFFDTGTPIDGENKNRIFHPFFSTKNHFGLGLAIAKKGMNRIGGRIDEPHAEGSGKRIRILLPLVRASGQESGPMNREV